MSGPDNRLRYSGTRDDLVGALAISHWDEIKYDVGVTQKLEGAVQIKKLQAQSARLRRLKALHDKLTFTRVIMTEALQEICKDWDLSEDPAGSFLTSRDWGKAGASRVFTVPPPAPSYG